MIQFAKKVTASTTFQVVIIALILTSGLLSGVETYTSHGESPATHRLITTAQNVILWTFVAEIVLKILACGSRPWRYFSSGWNLFDFLIVGVCLLPVDSQFGTVFRMARLVRTLRLVSILPKLQLLVGALLKSIPSLGYIGILLGLHFYMYAVVGTFMFGDNDPVRFGQLHTSFLSLFQVLTLEGWNDVLATQYLGSEVGYDDAWKVLTAGARVSAAQPVVATIYFVSFIMLGTMIMLNLFTGVIIGAMEEASNEAAANKRQKLLGTGGKLTLDVELAEVSQQLRELSGRLEVLTDARSKEDQA